MGQGLLLWAFLKEKVRSWQVTWPAGDWMQPVTGLWALLDLGSGHNRLSDQSGTVLKSHGGQVPREYVISAQRMWTWRAEGKGQATDAPSGVGNLLNLPGLQWHHM